MAKEKNDIDKSKVEAIRNAISMIEKNFGKGTIMKMGDQAVEEVSVIKSGSIGLDVALGVGEIGRAHV